MRRLALLAAVVVLLAVAGYSAYWLYVAREIRAGLEPWAEARQRDGYAIHWEKASLGGFPLAFRLHFDNVTVKAPQPVSYDGDAAVVELTAAPWNLRRWQITASQGGHLAAPAEGVGFDLGATNGTVTLGAPAGAVVDLAAHDISGRDLAGGLHVAAARAAITLPAKAPQSHLDDALDASVQLTQVTLPVAVRPFGKTIERLSLAATLKGGLPAGPLRASLAAWRDDGGTIELRRGNLTWGALGIDATGTFALDGDLQPIGALTATIRGQDAVVDAAVASGSLRAQDAAIAKLVLGLMAKTGADGRREITLPVSLQNERLYLGPAQIASLPRIAWR